MAVSVALSQGDGPAVVDELQIYSPLMLDEEDPDSGAGGGGRTLQFVPDGSDDLAERPFEIFTRGEGEEGWTLHAGGRLSSGRPDVEPLPPLDPEALKAELTPQDPVEFYAMRSATGIYLGPSYHTIESAWATEGESLAILALNDSVDATGMELHPLLLDGCFQVLSLARHHTVAEQGAVYMPFGWQRLWVAGPMPTRLLCHATVRTSAARNGADAASSEPPEVVTGDVRFYSTEGAPLGGLLGFTVKRATRGALLSARAGMKDLLYEVAWREQPLDGSVPAADFLTSPATVAGQSRTLAEHLADRDVEAADRVTLLRDLKRLSQAYVVSADGAGTAEQLAAELASRNQTVLLVRAEGDAGGPSPEVPGVTTAVLEPSDREAWRSLLEGLPEESPLRGVVHLNALDGRAASATTEEMAEDVTHAASTALALAQGVIDAGVGPTEGVWFVTRGAQVLEQDLLQRTSGELAGATLWGFGKAMSWEASHLQPRLIDLDPSAEPPAASELAHELLFADSETLIAHRGGVRRAARLIRPGADDPRLALPEDPDWVVGPEDPEAGLTALRAKPRPRPDLEPGEIRVAVEAMGLNFVDAPMSIGAVSTGGEIGRELVGRVLETGENVEGLATGDPVAGMGFGSFTPEMVTNAALVVPAPAGLSTAALATVPICFVTADLAFRTADLQAGERVLIHAGAGGVGLAAIQLAQAAGAEVFATASAAKQSFLRSLGVAHVFDSRETAFGDEIPRATDGEGVHVVLNSLTSEGFIEASLACLAPGGRFVEIGKRGIWSEREMSASRPDVALGRSRRSGLGLPGRLCARVLADRSLVEPRNPAERRRRVRRRCVRGGTHRPHLEPGRRPPPDGRRGRVGDGGRTRRRCGAARRRPGPRTPLADRDPRRRRSPTGGRRRACRLLLAPASWRVRRTGSKRRDSGGPRSRGRAGDRPAAIPGSGDG